MTQAFAQDPYGNGLDPEPLEAGEYLTHDDGDLYEFLGIVDGLLLVRADSGEILQKSPSEFSVELAVAA